MKACPKCFANYPDDFAVCPKDGSTLRDTSVWQVNNVIREKYKILALIGEGGMATVYKARHQLLDELRALKVIKPELASDPQFVQRFKNEAIIARKLRHPHAVHVEDLDLAEDGRPFIAMELVQGESLKSRIEREGPIPVAVVLDIALQVCQALEAAHASGMIHRDIKPDNIFLVTQPDAAPIAKVLDFGIARLKEGVTGQSMPGMTLTGTGVVIGTPEYMSPEQAMGKRGEQLDGRSDLYSLGIVMYRMLTGELPFKAETTVEMILHHIQTRPQAPQSLKPQLGIPNSVSALVMKALEKDRERRFPSAAAMAEAIRAPRVAQMMVAAPRTAAAAEPAGPRQVKTPAPTTPASPQPQPVAAMPSRLEPAPPLPARPSRFPTLAALAGILAVALIILGISVYRRRHLSQTGPASTPEAPQPGLATSSGAAGTETSVAAKSAAPGGAPPSFPAHLSPRESAPAANPAGEKSIVPTEAAKSSQQPGGNSGQALAERQGAGLESQPGPGAKSGENLRGKESPAESQLAQEGQQLLDNEKYALAAQKFRQILDINPDNGRARQNLQRSLMGLGRRLYDHGAYAKAAFNFRKVLEIKPDNREAQEALRKCREAMRDR